MPQKNRHFPFLADCFYHVYNRGVNKKPIFFDDKDYWIFRRVIRERLIDFGSEVSLGAFALMDNHYHLLLHQANERSISQFMKSISIRYTLYLRKKYGFDGNQFATSYRAVVLRLPEEVTKVKDYILRNPIEAGFLTWKHVGRRI